MVNLSETIQRRRHERKMELQRQRRQRKREAREEAERERLNGSRRSSLVSAACSSGSSTRRGSMVEINGEIEGERQEWLDRSALIQRIIKEEQEEIELELQNNQNVDMNDVSMYNEVTILDVINMSSQPTEQKDESRIQQRTSERIRQNAEATNLQKKVMTEEEKLAKHREVQRDRQRRHRARLSEQAKAREKDESPRSLSQDPKIDEQRQSNGPNLRKRAAPPAKSVESECEELAVEEEEQTMNEDALTRRIIEQISQEPSLFDVDHEDYSNDNQRHRAFTRIQERLTASGVALQQATTVRDKFRILKRRFINEYQRHGKDSTWPLFKPLDFLIPYVVAFNERKKLGVPSRKRTYTQKADLPSLAKEKDQLEKISIESLLKLFPESAYTASASSPRTELNVSNLTNGSKRNGAQPTQEDEDFSLSLFFKQNGCDGLNDGNNRSHEVSRESSISTPSPASEHPTLAAYRIRQTYLFLRVESTNKPVFCKANDEDFFPPNRTNTTVADRVKLRPGQIITAFFGYNQTETTCVVEAVGTLDAVMQQYRQTIVQELQGKMPNGNSSNGSPEGGDNCVEALRSLFPQPQTNQNGEEDRLSPSSSESLVHSPSKMPRLQVESTNNDEIDRRFARLESRIRVLEERVDFEKDQ
ncbi:hypothetical protein M3Y96_00152100 [Aphelenchoides besseyi]|nr:hypothetical protein M3Y96_00152100 [Aphelenchoides besseyi]